MPLLYVKAKGIVERDVYAHGWGGSLLASAFRGGDEITLVRIGPLLAKGRPVAGTPERPQRLRKGTPVEFTLTASYPTIFDAPLEHKVRVGGGIIELGQVELVDISLADNLLLLEPPSPGETLVVLYHPTIFSYKGRRVLYPSPQRFILSISKRLLEVYGEDIRERAENIACRTELVAWHGGVGAYDIGRGRKVKAFHGKAVYQLDTDSLNDDDMWILRLLLAAAKALGVGRSRGIGFGTVEFPDEDKTDSRKPI